MGDIVFLTTFVLDESTLNRHWHNHCFFGHGHEIFWKINHARDRQPPQSRRALGPPLFS